MKNARFALTPEAKAALDQLFAKHADQVHEEQLIAAAEPANSPLHDLLTWDNRAAAHDYRKMEAARILRSYHIVRFRIVHGAKKERASVSVPFAVKVKATPEAEKVWTRTTIALKNEYSRDQLIAERIAWVRRGIKQLLVVPELVPLYNELEQVIEKFKPPGTVAPKAEVN